MVVLVVEEDVEMMMGQLGQVREGRAAPWQEPTLTQEPLKVHPPLSN